MSEIRNDPTPVQTTVRNATVETVVDLLEHQRARRVDMVVPAGSIASFGGRLHVTGVAPVIDDDGVTDPNGAYLPTDVCDEGLSAKLDIPRGYLRRMREKAIDMYDGNINGWMNHPDNAGKKWLLRAFRGDDATAGVARAFLSDSYELNMDNLDVLTVALEGLSEAGLGPDNITGCDLSDRRMHVRVSAPQVQALAPVLLAGYRSPFGDGTVRRAGDVDHWREVAAREGLGYAPGTEPVVFAGFDISNSETGNGAYTLTPRLVVKICKNGLTITSDAIRAVHLGSRLDAGAFRWSADTQEKQLAVIRAKTRDAVARFLSPEYLAEQVALIEAKAGAPVADPVKAIEVVGKTLAYSDGQRASILDHFIRGGQMTAGGVLNAVTSVAQTIDDPDAAADLESSALRVLDLVASAGR